MNKTSVIIIFLTALCACSSEGTKRIESSREAEKAICTCDSIGCATEALARFKRVPGVFETDGISGGEREQVEASLRRTLKCVEGLEKL